MCDVSPTQSLPNVAHFALQLAFFYHLRYLGPLIFKGTSRDISWPLPLHLRSPPVILTTPLTPIYVD